jgi:hypothetical protein
MIRRFIAYAGLFFALPTAVLAQGPRADQARLTLGVPVYVTHPKERPGPQDWNEGWFHNEGIVADISWPVWRLGQDTRLRLGASGGVFDNSIFRTSAFLGGVAEIESFATPRLAFSLGTYGGAITGYEQNVAPAIAPYLGASYAVSERVELGVRGFWLPAETLAGSDLAPSDAYVGVITLGTRF